MLPVSSLFTCSLIAANVQLIPKIYILIPSLQRHHPLPGFLPVFNLWYILRHHELSFLLHTGQSHPCPRLQLAFVDDSNCASLLSFRPMQPSTYGASIYPQPFHMHLKLKVLQTQFGIYFLHEPKCIFFPGAVHLSEASTQLPKL